MNVPAGTATISPAPPLPGASVALESGCPLPDPEHPAASTTAAPKIRRFDQETPSTRHPGSELHRPSAPQLCFNDIIITVAPPFGSQRPSDTARPKVPALGPSMNPGKRVGT